MLSRLSYTAMLGNTEEVDRIQIPLVFLVAKGFTYF